MCADTRMTEANVTPDKSAPDLLSGTRIKP
ncbi:unnamed protein product [Gemmata massiliana]|uniref:Uncharacterized protein n=1 Tax=Gemmata massiliana TaxID=1210884 RepID=A0A6P2CYB5_9BACT|nr:unnamed protein product [Gemmata massiliana]